MLFLVNWKFLGADVCSKLLNFRECPALFMFHACPASFMKSPHFHQRKKTTFAIGTMAKRNVTGESSGLQGDMNG